MGDYTTTDWIWMGIGFGGQACFFGRFFVQWLASEREKRSIVPVAFWWMSLAGASILLSYAIYRRDPVIIVGQLFGFFVYSRNLYLIARERAALQAAAE